MTMRVARRLSAMLVLVSIVSACGSSVPPATPGPSLTMLTIPVPVQTADKAVIEAAAEILSDRLRALGIEDFSSTAGAGLVFQIPVSDPSVLPTLEGALKARGIVEFLPGGDDIATEGDPAPDVAPIFDAGTQIRSAELVDDGSGGKAVSIELEPDGTKALADYTTANVGGSMILALDGVVIAAPVIMEALLDGKVRFSFQSTAPVPPAAIAAIMAAGPMPDGWAAP
jgi:hypothetical protein